MNKASSTPEVSAADNARDTVFLVREHELRGLAFLVGIALKAVNEKSPEAEVRILAAMRAAGDALDGLWNEKIQIGVVFDRGNAHKKAITFAGSHTQAAKQLLATASQQVTANTVQVEEER